jgi:hypothetical protein
MHRVLHIETIAQKKLFSRKGGREFFTQRWERIFHAKVGENFSRKGAKKIIRKDAKRVCNLEESFYISIARPYVMGCTLRYYCDGLHSSLLYVAQFRCVRHASGQRSKGIGI